MDTHEGRLRIASSTLRMSPLGKVIAVLAGSVLLVAGLVFSLLFLAAATIAGSIWLGYIWLRTRKLRAHIRVQLRGARAGTAPGHRVIEGEFIRDNESREGPQPGR